jgi:hypothetical protein
VDRRNWSTYCKKRFQVTKAQDLLGIIDGTKTKPTDELWNLLGRAAWIRADTEVQYLIVTTTPPIIHDHRTLEMSAHKLFNTLKGLFEKEPTTTTTVHDVRHNHTMQVAAHTSRTPDNRTCTQCAAMMRCAPVTESETGREDKGRAHRARKRRGEWARRAKHRVGELKKQPQPRDRAQRPRITIGLTV